MSITAAPAPRQSVCSVTVAPGVVCGHEAIYVLRSSRAEHFECAEHFSPAGVVMVDAPAAPVAAAPKSRSTAPYLLVSEGRIVGYAHSKSPAVIARAARLGAEIVPHRA